jgi:16S rRNA processing protein RimM
VTQDRRKLPDYLEIGVVLRPHGVRGEMVVEANSGLLPGLSPGTEVLIGRDRKKMIVERIRPHRGRLLLMVQSIHDRNQAEELRNARLYLRADQVEPLPEGEYYYWQILGLEVQDESGDKIGIVNHIIETGANDVYVLEAEDGSEILIPAIEDVVLNVDLEQERMIVRLLPGLI